MAGRLAGHRGHHARPRDILHQVAVEDAIGGERAGLAREDHLADAHLGGDIGGMQPAGAAEGQQREIARVEPLLEQREPHRRAEIGIGDRQHALRRRLDASPSGPPTCAAIAARVAGMSSCIAPPRK